ncbi:MAG TPA: DNA-binding domain-containing protein [Pirellulales bacterium]|jgi:hypothetical protein|nr:DNA-binding domain-containing protein [Pirellulales bacterium]
MSASAHDLATIQAWMQSVITHRAGVVDGIASADARALIDLPPADVEQVIGRSSRQTSVERLAIYSGAYFARLLECVRAEYPIMAQAMGTELFDEFAVEYLERYPSHSYTLNDLGANFPRFLAETRPSTPDEDNSWLDFLVDLAKLEWCFAEVFDGLGAENLPLLGLDELQGFDADSWAEARLRAVPCLRILRLDFPVQLYYRAIRERAEAVPPDREPTWLAVSRRNFVVRHHTLAPAEAEILEAILAGATVGEAIGRAAPPSDFAAFAEDLRRWFHLWTAEGFFLTVALDGSST